MILVQGGQEDVISCVHFLTADGMPASDPRTPAWTGAFPCPLFRTARVTHAPLFIPNSEGRLSCSSWSLSKGVVRGWGYAHGPLTTWEEPSGVVGKDSFPEGPPPQWPHSVTQWSCALCVWVWVSSDNLYAIKDACSPWSCHCYSGAEMNTLHLVTLPKYEQLSSLPMSVRNTHATCLLMEG